MSKKNAIIVYVDNKPKFIEEFSWIWKSWLMWDINEEWDLIAICHPDAEEELNSKFKHDDLIIKPQVPLSETNEFWKDYKFVNSFAYFEDESNIELIKNYKFVLKTDCDTFLTKHFKGFKPWRDKVYLGLGQFYSSRYTSDLRMAVFNKLQLFADKFKLNKNLITNVGASMICQSIELVAVCKLQLKMTEAVLKLGFPDGKKGHWPGWFRGVASMYAGELAVNHLVSASRVQQGSLDVWCAENEISSVDLHIHAWQQNDVDLFNKMKYHNGELPKIKRNNIPDKAGDYCHMITCQPIEELKLLAEKST